MRATMQRYLECIDQGDVDAVLGLFSESISVEDPVGGPAGTHAVGHEAVEAFFRKGFARSRPSPTLTGPIRITAGNEAAMPFVLRLELRGKPHEVDVIDVMTFDEAGRISKLRAFWHADEIRPLES
jgi:steroid delta-isomerase